MQKVKRHSAEEKRWFGKVAEIKNCVLCGSYGTQVAHRNGAGMALKAQPWETAALCPTCHYHVDNGDTFTLDERRRMMGEAIHKTHAILALMGVEIPSDIEYNPPTESGDAQ